MPRANENIIAKFMAQIDTGVSSLMSTNDPADATSPAMVNVKGSPAAMSAPKARTRIAMVIGHDNISDFSIEARLASLKSDQDTDDPVAFTLTDSVERPCSSALSAVATLTIPLGSSPAP